MTPARIAAKITTPAQLALVQATIVSLEFEEEVALAAGLEAKAVSIARVRENWEAAYDIAATRLGVA